MFAFGDGDKHAKLIQCHAARFSPTQTRFGSGMIPAIPSAPASAPNLVRAYYHKAYSGRSARWYLG
jgi:hypothetical protein